MRNTAKLLAAGALVLAPLIWLQPAVDGKQAAKESKAVTSDADYYPELAKKIVPILSAGSSVAIGVAQVQGEEKDVDRVKVVAQLETDYKDWARIKILVPVRTESLKEIDRVPGVSVSAIADYTVSK